MSLQHNPFLKISDEVQDSLASGKAVVALESTIIAHGMPYPQNVETGRLLESTVREFGAVPATIALFDGQICVGLSDDELERLGKEGRSLMKLSRKDLPLALSQKVAGATTVAATMWSAAQAGIRFFATGGIGGVHRNASETFDVSADLYELAETPVAVVCAGAKSILDLPATLELLETLSVPVLGYQTDAFPAFYSQDSGEPVQQRFDDMEALAHYFQVKWSLDPRGGAVVANPIPKEHALDSGEMESVITQALQKAKEQGIRGKETTPFLLQAVKDLTQGRSLTANIALAKNNAALAAKLAVSFHTA